MAGYHGFSMSNNAVAAYENDEKPFSKWTKTEIVEALFEFIENEEIKIEIKKMKAESLKQWFLKMSSWHHTSKFFNKTTFYQICVETEAEVIKILEERRKLIAADEEYLKSKII